jgi:hypothetical protein
MFSRTTLINHDNELLLFKYIQIFSRRVGSNVTAPGKLAPLLKQQGGGSSGPYFFIFVHYELIEEDTGGARHRNRNI